MTEDYDIDELFEDSEAENLACEEPVPYSAVEATVIGEVMRVVYSNNDGSFSVIRLETDKHQEVTLIGCLPNVMEGQEIEACGRWELNKEHGRQLRVTSFHAILPSTEEGIARFLSSGVLPGIGEVYARRIVDYFGKDTIKILDNYSERLKEVPGIGRKRIKEIREAWTKSSSERETRIFLQGLGLSPSQCIKLCANYGSGAAAEIVRRNPYRLASEIDGIGFIRADAIAKKMNVADNDPLRLCAGMVFAMEEMASRGHTCCPEPILLMEAEKLLSVSADALKLGLQTATEEGKLAKEEIQEGGEIVSIFFLRRLRICEMNLAHSLRVLLSIPPKPLSFDYECLGVGWQRLNTAQRQSVKFAFEYGFSIVTGGPGVGKTTVVRQMVQVAKYLRQKVYLAAPTGRAAKRLSEATGLEAQTIHRLLKWDVKERKFYHDEGAPLDCDFLVVDEVSMLDTQLADSLFKAIKPGARVVLVGDKDQLPSVGPGAVLCDLIASKRFPVTFLTEVYRQSEGSRIITNAHAVNNGNMPDLRAGPAGALADFYWVEQDDPVKVAQIIAKTVVERIPAVFGFNPMTDVQVLTPMRKGDCGTLAINEILQKALNPPADGKPSFEFGSRIFRVGDKVMQTSNNYDKGVFNGEMGLVASIDGDNKKFSVAFDVGLIEYQQHEAEQLQLAYAVTVHKSQGSEFPVVLMPVLTQHYVMLQKNLVYTGMTRAKKLLIMLGTRRAMALAVGNDKPNKRCTRLVQRLVE